MPPVATGAGACLVDEPPPPDDQDYHEPERFDRKPEPIKLSARNPAVQALWRLCAIGAGSPETLRMRSFQIVKQILAELQPGETAEAVIACAREHWRETYPAGQKGASPRLENVMRLVYEARTRRQEKQQAAERLITQPAPASTRTDAPIMSREERQAYMRAARGQWAGHD